MSTTKKLRCRSPSMRREYITNGCPTHWRANHLRCPPTRSNPWPAWAIASFPWKPGQRAMRPKRSVSRPRMRERPRPWDSRAPACSMARATPGHPRDPLRPHRINSFRVIRVARPGIGTGRGAVIRQPLVDLRRSLWIGEKFLARLHDGIGLAARQPPYGEHGEGQRQYHHVDEKRPGSDELDGVSTGGGADR